MYRLIPSVSDFNTKEQLPTPGDRRNFDNQQELLTILQRQGKAYKNQYKQFNGTMVISENKGKLILYF